MIGYATHVPKLRCLGNEEGVFLGESYVVKLERKKLKKIKRKWEEKRGNRLLLPFDEMKFPPSITHGNKTDVEIEGENFQIVSYDFLKLL